MGSMMGLPMQCPVIMSDRWAMLEKMFPRAGAKVPEVRFKGFDGEWRSYEFSEVYERINAKSSM